MPNLNMYGAYALNSEEVKKRVDPNKKGNYAFGTLGEDGMFYVYYVGRSDTDLQAEIIARSSDFTQLSHFMYSYASSAKEAYEKECKNYHDFNCPALLNKIHPDRPNGTSYHCPICGYPMPNYMDIFKSLTHL